MGAQQRVAAGLYGLIRSRAEVHSAMAARRLFEVFGEHGFKSLAQAGA